MAKENIHIDYLIARHLNKEASNEEEEQLRYWREESLENQNYFKDLKMIFDETSELKVDTSFDVDAAWNKIAPLMHRKKKIIEFIPRYWHICAAAASILLLIGIWWGIADNRSVNPSTDIVIAANIEETQTKLPDNTSVTVAANSSITYSEGYGKTNRQVELKGNASFDVHHQNGPAFIVKAGETFVRDIGTAFDVNQKDTSIVEVYVKTGSVMFYTTSNKGILLKQGETGIYNKKTKVFNKIEAVKEKPEQSDSEPVKSFTFNDTELEEVITLVEKAFSTRIILANEQLKHCTITVSFENEDINTILEIIAETLNLEVDKFANGYLLKGEECTSNKE